MDIPHAVTSRGKSRDQEHPVLVGESAPRDFEQVEKPAEHKPVHGENADKPTSEPPDVEIVESEHTEEETEEKRRLSALVGCRGSEC